MAHQLIFQGPVFTGDLILNEAKLLSIPAKEHYNVVDIAFKSSGMNAVMMTIKLPDLNYANKCILADEVVNRWNAAPYLQKENEQLRVIMQELLGCEDDDVSLSSELHARIKDALESQSNINQDTSDGL